MIARPKGNIAGERALLHGKRPSRGWRFPAKTKAIFRSLTYSPLMFFFAFLSMVTSAFPFPVNNTSEGAADSWPSIPGAPPFSEWPYPLMCLLVAVYSSISLRYPNRSCLKINFGLMTALVDLAWMVIVLDGTLSPSTRWR